MSIEMDSGQIRKVAYEILLGKEKEKGVLCGKKKASEIENASKEKSESGKNRWTQKGPRNPV